MPSDPIYYPIAALDREKANVWLRLPGAGEVRGYVRFTRRGRVILVPTEDGKAMERAADHLQNRITLWRPIDPATWPDPLPSPAVLMADPPPLPAPIDRRRARLAPAGAPPLPEAIAYAPPGEITLAECEARMLRALLTDRALPDTDRAKLRVRSNWPETGYGPGDYPPEIQTRWRPFPQDSGDYLTAMGWFARLQPFERRMVRLRARGMSFTRMGEECGGRSDEWARQQYIQALVRAHGIANEPVASHRPPAHGRLVPA